MSRRETPPGPTCPDCGVALESTGPSAGAGDAQPMRCPRCGNAFRARPRVGNPSRAPRRPIGGLTLFCRSQVLRTVLLVYRLGLGLGTAALLVCGGFVPVIRGWLDDSVSSWGGLVVAILGGVSIRHGRVDPDADFGPILRAERGPSPLRHPGRGGDPARSSPAGAGPARVPPLLRRGGLGPVAGLAARPPAALRPGESANSARSWRMSWPTWPGGMPPGRPAWSGRWRSWIGRWTTPPRPPGGRSGGGPWLAGESPPRCSGRSPRGRKPRADRLSASIAGGRDAASALVKVALIQPLFRELLAVLDIEDPATANLYATFRRFWEQLPGPLVDAMRLRLLTITEAVDHSPHPPLADRVAQLHGLPRPAGHTGRSRPGGDPPGRRRMDRADAPRSPLQLAPDRAHRLPLAGHLTRPRNGRVDHLLNPTDLEKQPFREQPCRLGNRMRK